MFRVFTYLLSIAAIVAIAMGGSWALQKYKNRSKGEAVAKVEIAFRGTEESAHSFIESELKLVRSERILGEIVDEFALNQLWAVSRSQAFDRAKQKFEIKQIPSTKMICLSYMDENPEVAMEILKSIIEKHRIIGKKERKGAAEVMGEQ